MILGILVNSNRHQEVVVGLSRAAAASGHQVVIFMMDTGTRLLAQPACTALAEESAIAISYCQHSAQELGVDTSGLPAAIVAGSQYNNAAMNHQADRVVVL